MRVFPLFKMVTMGVKSNFFAAFDGILPHFGNSEGLCLHCDRSRLSVSCLE